MLTRWFDTSVLPSATLFRRSLFDDDIFQLDRRFERLWNQAQGHGIPRFGWHVSDDNAVLQVELPGVRLEDLKLSVQEGTLTLAGERGASVPEGYRALRQERQPLAFSQTFTLTKDLDGTRAEARFENGLLTVSVPKRPEVQPRVIPIQAGPTVIAASAEETKED